MWVGSVFRVATVTVLIVLSGCAGSKPSPEQNRWSNDPSRRDQLPREQWREVDVELPAYPLEDDLIPFQIRGDPSFSFLIDERSVRIDEDAVVRFTVVARASSGYDNVSYEGIHCEEDRYKVYAVGTTGRQWSKIPQPQWKELEPKANNDHRYSLYLHYLCPNGFPHARVRSAVLALKHGKPVFKSR